MSQHPAHKPSTEPDVRAPAHHAPRPTAISPPAERAGYSLPAASATPYYPLFEHHPLPAWVFDPADLTILDVNEAAVRHYGFPRHEFLRLSVKDLHPPEDLPAFLHRLADAAEGGREAGTWRHRKKDGTVIPVELVWQDVACAGRRARLVLARVVAPGGRSGEEVRESEQLLRQLAENVRAVFWMTDAGAARLLFVSPMYEEVWGRSCDSLYQHPESWQQAIHPRDRTAAARVFGRFLREGTAYVQEYRVVRPDGSVRLCPFLAG